MRQRLGWDTGERVVTKEEKDLGSSHSTKKETYRGAIGHCLSLPGDSREGSRERAGITIFI